MIRTIIIEDEKPAVRRLEKLLGLFSDLEVVASLNSVEEAVVWFQENEHPQLIFSDIVLGDGLSFDIFDKVLLVEVKAQKSQLCENRVAQNCPALSL